MSAVGAAIGLNALASHLIPTNESTNSVILCVGLAVGVDYSLFYLRREREERARGRDHLDAVELAAATSGHAVVVSGLSVIVAMAGLFLAQDALFSSFAVGAILVVAASVLGSLTVLPAVLAKLGRWIDRPRVPLLWRLASRSGTPRFWPMVLRPTLRHPKTTLVASVTLLLALALPALGMTLRMTSVSDLPRNTATLRTYDRIAAAFPRAGTTHQVAVRAPAAAAPQVAAALDDLVSRTRGDRLFTQDETVRPKVSADGTIAALPVATAYADGTAGAKQSLQRLRQDLLPATVGKVSGAEYAVSGGVAGDVDYADHIKEKLPLVIGFVLLLTLIVMTMAFRSVVVAVKAALLNLLSVGAAYGVLVLVFQHTWAEGILGFGSNGAIASWLPLFLFVILFGLSMDYHVFVVSRIREAVLRGVPNRQAVAEGIVGSAGVVTSAAAIMIAVFSIFGTLSMLEMKQMGVGLAVAIAIDATIIRAVVLPSAMILLGKANWWAPRFLRRRDDPTSGQPVTEAVSTVPELTVGAPR
jgi:RND superfamily putative drug exporter